MAPTPPVGSVGLPGPQGALIAESDPRYNDVVLAFLQNHGFSRAEEAFRKDIEAQNNNSPQPQDGEGAQPAASTSKAGGAAAAGAAQPTASGSKPAAGTPTAASNTLNLPTLIQKSSNVPNPRQAGQQAPLGGPTPPDAHVVFNYLLQTLPPASLTALGLTAAAAAKAAEERDRRAAVGASIGNGVGGNIVKVLEPMERVIGYEGLKRWVESGLEGWKVRCPPLRLESSTPGRAHELILILSSLLGSLGRAEASPVPCLCAHLPRPRGDRLPTSRCVPPLPSAQERVSLTIIHFLSPSVQQPDPSLRPTRPHSAPFTSPLCRPSRPYLRLRTSPTRRSPVGSGPRNMSSACRAVGSACSSGGSARAESRASGRAAPSLSGARRPFEGSSTRGSWSMVSHNLSCVPRRVS